MPNLTDSRAVGIIPARWASSRFPGKPLARIAGKPMIEWVYKNACQASSLSDLVVATDDRQIYEAVTAFGGKVAMTSRTHPTGTDRCAELARQLTDVQIVVNIQGDEPFVAASQIDSLVDLMRREQQFEIATLARPLRELDAISNPNVVKVVFDRQQRALYFSRSVLPYDRAQSGGVKRYQHLGIYAFRRHVLLDLGQLAPTELETAESLEQLRWLEHGYAIGIGLTETETISIDHPEDVRQAESWIHQHKLKV
ncbi:MAG: 3-deoxy-manno-octulosonate cytidylyltransferase [Bacteroidota bacterium]